jgi:hypothetical protein
MRVANAKELTKMKRMLVLVIAGLMSPQDFVCRVGKTNVHASFVAVYVQDSLEFAALTCEVSAGRDSSRKCVLLMLKS